MTEGHRVPLLKRRSFRRGLLIGSTILTLILVFIGAVPLNLFLGSSIETFTWFWLLVLLLVGFILVLAFYDLARIRAEHRARLRTLQEELANAADEMRQISAETQALIDEELGKGEDETSEK